MGGDREVSKKVNYDEEGGELFCVRGGKKEERCFFGEIRGGVNPTPKETPVRYGPYRLLGFLFVRSHPGDSVVLQRDKWISELDGGPIPHMTWA